MGAAINLEGRRFGKLVAVKRADPLYKKATFWLCRCDCGREKVINAMSLRRTEKNKPNGSRTCGCGQIKKGEKNTTSISARERHGADFVPFSNAWYRRAAGIMKRCRNLGIPCDFPNICNLASHLIDIAPTHCPVFGFELTPGVGFRSPQSPSVDRILPQKGYVRGNLQVISHKANVMKQDASPEDLERFAEWIMRGVYK